MFNHQRLKCFQMMLEMLRDMPRLTRAWPRGTGYLVDQLRRATSSVALNIAEGNARRSIQERRRFFEIAVGSANEVAAILDVAFNLSYIDKFECDKNQARLLEVIKMVSRLP